MRFFVNSLKPQPIYFQKHDKFGSSYFSKMTGGGMVATNEMSQKCGCAVFQQRKLSQDEHEIHRNEQSNVL